MSTRPKRGPVRALALAAALLCAGGAAAAEAPADAELLKVAPGDWLTANRDYAGDRFSPLNEITASNAGRLSPVCMLQLGEMGSFETSPLAYAGRLYLTTVHRTFAVDGRSCAVLWSHTYTPTEAEHIPGNRGVALYRGKVYRGTTDGYLLALDAATGKLVWKVQVGQGDAGYFISGAPVAFDGRIYVGEGGADHGIRGHINAFDAETGRRVWRFDVIPPVGAPERASWGDADARGGSSWSSVAIDPERRLVLAPTGNPGPDFDGASRPGPNLYTDSVVALDAATGKLAWYVQQVPHDVHDWDTAAAPAIYERAGRRYMAVASKDGFLHLYDRSTQAEIARPETTTRRNTEVPVTAAGPVTYCPGGLGQWNGPAYAPASGLLFVGTADRCDTIQSRAKPAAFTPGRLDLGGRIMTDRSAPATGWVRALDAETGKPVWSRPFPTPIVAGVTPTAGGVLFTGDLDGRFLVLEASSGRTLYSFMTGGGVAGGVTTYAAGGRQYVAVPSGNASRGTWASTGSATLIVFALP